MKLFVWAALFVGIVFAQDASVTKDAAGKFLINLEKMDDSALAWGRFADELDKDGWGKLSVFTNAEAEDNDKMYAAGFIEGYLTQKRIFETYMNYKDTSLEDFPDASHKPGEWPEVVMRFMKENEEYTRKKAAAPGSDKPEVVAFWEQVALQMKLFDGLVAGYNAAAPEDEKITVSEFWLLNAMGDMDDLGIALFLDYEDHVARLHEDAELHSHCTGLVKIVKDSKGWFSDVFVAQDAWSGYSTMNRMLKTYDYKLKAESTKTRAWVMSSYPGVLFSQDDFYVTDTKLNIIETTFHCWDNDLYRRFVRADGGVMTWIRAPVATRLSKTGMDFSKFFSIENSGTYNNQYMVVDHKLFDVGTKPKPEFVVAVEQMPGLMMTVDRTPMLIEEGFVPSINVPSIIEIYNYAKYPEKVANTSNYWSYNESSRMHIIRRDQAKIQTYEDFRAFMRYNNYLKDPMCLSDPGQTISSRYDLRNTVLPLNSTARPFGGTDSKTTNHWWSLRMTFDAVAGPTLDGGLPAWDFKKWNDEHPDQIVPHRGIPDGPWPKEPLTFAFDEFGLGHGLGKLAIVGLVAVGVSVMTVASWFGWSMRRKEKMPAFNKNLPQDYETLPQADPLAQEQH